MLKEAEEKAQEEDQQRRFAEQQAKFEAERYTIL